MRLLASRCASLLTVIALVAACNPAPRLVLVIEPDERLQPGESAVVEARGLGIEGPPQHPVTWEAEVGSVEPLPDDPLQAVYTAPPWPTSDTITVTVHAPDPLTAELEVEVVAPEPDPEPDPEPEPEPVTVRLLAAGDIACNPNDRDFNDGEGNEATNRCMQGRTAALAEGLGPDAVIALGDLQYGEGTYSQFMGSYHLSWGRLNDVILPILGNHELWSNPVNGYFRYFDEQGVWDRLPEGASDPARAYYAVDLGAWRVILLNTNCTDPEGNDDSVAGGCDVGSPQHAWLEGELAAADAAGRCALVAFHHPRFNSGRNDDEPLVDALWRAAHAGGADLILAADEHRYERYHPLDADGERDDEDGVPYFVVGTGGRNLYDASVPYETSAVMITGEYGLLQLDLSETGFEFEFVPAEGYTATDAGAGDCR